MSLLKSIIGAAAPIVGGIFGGPAGAALGGAIGGAMLSSQNTMTAMPGTGSYASLSPIAGMGALPAIGTAAGVAVRYAGSAARGAVALCRRYPTWCATIGGTAAVEAMMRSGQLPVPKHRRGRGLSSRDLRSYRRVHNLLAGFCSPKAHIRKVKSC